MLPVSIDGKEIKKIMKDRFLLCTGFFFLLFIVFFPVDFLNNFQYAITSFLFGDLTEWISVHILHFKKARIDFSSDSISMVVLVSLLLILSIILSILVQEKYHRRLLHLFKEICVLYLAVILMKYGFDKIFKAQFYLPEPNILYSRFGTLDKDILFWSTMGTSHLYSVFTGTLELTSAFFILFNRTRTVGLLISIGMFINIVGINLGFDISVKLFSLILLLMAVFSLEKEWNSLFQFLVLKKEKKLKEEHIFIIERHPMWMFFKTLFLGLSLVMVVFPYLNSGNYNDDTVERAFLHGAFENIDKESEIQYVFFHRNHYLILMDKNDNRTDFHYSLESSTKLILEDYTGKSILTEFSYQKKDSILTIAIGKNRIQAKELDWRKMNALQPLFHTAIEEVK